MRTERIGWRKLMTPTPPMIAIAAATKKTASAN
jgi:hypothetical protein